MSLTLTVLSISAELISRWTATGERARCVMTVVLTAAVTSRAFVDVCHRSHQHCYTYDIICANI